MLTNDSLLAIFILIVILVLNCIIQNLTYCVNVYDSQMWNYYNNICLEPLNKSWLKSIQLDSDSKLSIILNLI